MSMMALHYEWAVGLPTISKIVPEVLKAIYLRPERTLFKNTNLRARVARDGARDGEFVGIFQIAFVSGVSYRTPKIYPNATAL